MLYIYYYILYIYMEKGEKKGEKIPIAKPENEQEKSEILIEINQ
jgi:hypothetical protein